MTGTDAARHYRQAKRTMNDRERLTVVILHVADLEASLRFYRDLMGVPLEPGLNEPADDPWIGGHHAELSWRGGAYLHFALFAGRPGQPATRGAELGFHMDDVLVLHRRMVEGAATVLHEPRTEPWGLTARYRDPDGNIVGITSR
jgi:lactoylglutathione lyase